MLIFPYQYSRKRLFIPVTELTERGKDIRLQPTGSKLGGLYGLCKVHKSSVDGCPPFRPILSAIDTPTYKLAKFLVPHLTPLTKNEYTVSDSYRVPYLLNFI